MDRNHLPSPLRKDRNKRTRRSRGRRVGGVGDGGGGSGGGGGGGGGRKETMTIPAACHRRYNQKRSQKIRLKKRSTAKFPSCSCWTAPPPQRPQEEDEEEEEEEEAKEVLQLQRNVAFYQCNGSAAVKHRQPKKNVLLRQLLRLLLRPFLRLLLRLSSSSWWR